MNLFKTSTGMSTKELTKLIISCSEKDDDQTVKKIILAITQDEKSQK